MVSRMKELKGTINNWWVFEFLGAFLIAVSILVFTFPVSSYAGLVIYFAVSFLASGIMRSIFAVTNRTNEKSWKWYLAGGAVDLLLGALLVTNLDVTAIVLSYFVGFYILMGGIAAIWHSLDRSSTGVKGSVWEIIVGVLAIALAVLIILNPEIGALTAITYTAMAFAAMGAFYMMLGLRLRKIKKIGRTFVGKLRTE